MSDWHSKGGGTVTPGTMGASSAPQTVTSGSTINTYGSWVELLPAASNPTDCDGFWLHLKSITSGQYRWTGINIGIGAAGSEQIVVADFPFAYVSQYGTATVWIPQRIAGGQRIAAQAKASAASLAIGVGFTLHHPALSASAAPGSCDTMGLDAATNAGTAVDPGATANTKGSWVEIAASTAHAYKYLILYAGTNRDESMAATDWLIDIGIGAAASEQVIVGDLYQHCDILEDPRPMLFTIPCDVNAGERLAVRCQSSSTNSTDRVIDVGLVGFY